ncbi:MAG: TlpA family protein disulfide reductase [Chryseobacterium sp.]|nr:MAG: TlpA family protein disulfide reductase [Chryseobacterium sp.]
MKNLYCFKVLLIYIALLNNHAYGQNSTRGLNIGDQAPDFLFKNAKNMPSKEVRLSDFRGKLVILDFWATNCGSCIQAMPKMDSLQKTFGDSIQIIIISPMETSERINSFMKYFRNIEIKNIIEKLPSIHDDSRWAEFFPHNSVPHHVWLDQNGKVIEISKGANTTVKNIREALRGKRSVLQLKDDFLSEKYPDLFLNNTATKPVFASAFYNHIPNMRKRIRVRDTTHNTFSQRSESSSLVEIVREFYFPNLGKQAPLPKFLGYTIQRGVERTIYEGDVIYKLYRPLDESLIDNWEKENNFIYELKVPLTAAMNSTEIAKVDIANYAMMKYNISVKEEEVEKECYVVKFTDVEKLKSKGKSSHPREFLVSNSVVKINNMPFLQFYKAFCSLLEDGGQVFGAEKDPRNIVASPVLPHGFAYLTGLPSKPVVFDTETQVGEFNFEVKGNFKDYKQLVSQMQSQGISISVEKRLVKYLVYSDKTSR